MFLYSLGRHHHTRWDSQPITSLGWFSTKRITPDDAAKFARIDERLFKLSGAAVGAQLWTVKLAAAADEGQVLP